MSSEKRKSEINNEDEAKDPETKRARHENETDNGVAEKEEQEQPPPKTKVKQPSGTILACGQMNWDMTGRKKLPKGVKDSSSCNLWTPHLLTATVNIKMHKVFACCTSAHSAAIDENGRVWTWGRNDHGQLGHGDTLRRDAPTLVKTLEHISMDSAAIGRNHSLFLTDDGVAYSCGNNSQGQCGVGKDSLSEPTPVKILFDTKVIKVACGAEFSMLLDNMNMLHSVGCPEYGQLGNNTDGKYMDGSRYFFHFESQPIHVKMFVSKSPDGITIPLRDVQIVDMACGANHTVALDKLKRVFCWGFGGYGRLGFSSPKDEFVPRLLTYFDRPNYRIDRVYAGTTFSLASIHKGATYMWGQRGSRLEANMYPKPITEINGWNIRSLSCSNTSIVIAADDSCVSWGPSPCHGELGHGEMRKCCPSPMDIRAIENLYVHEVACGMMHSMFIVRNDTDKDKRLIERLPEFDP